MNHYQTVQREDIQYGSIGEDESLYRAMRPKDRMEKRKDDIVEILRAMSAEFLGSFLIIFIGESRPFLTNSST